MALDQQYQWEILQVDAAGVETVLLKMGHGTYYHVLEHNGFGVTDLRVSDQARSGDDGDIPGEDFLTAKTYSLKVLVKGNSTGHTSTLVRDLEEAWYMPRSENERPLRWWIGGSGAPDYDLFKVRAIGRPRKTSIPKDNLPFGYALCDLEYYSPIGAVYSDALHTLQAQLQATSVGRDYPKTYPFTYAPSFQNAAITVTNAGIVAVKPLATISGPSSRPRVSQLTTGQILDLPLYVPQGSLLTIDFLDRTVLLDGVNVYRTTGDSSWWALLPGDNSIEYRSNSNVLTSVMNIYWRDAWIG